MCLADGAGTMVSYVHSLFSGTGVVMGDTGVLMNSRMLGFNLEEGHPNRLAPGKRPVHTLNTHVVRKAGESVLVGGLAPTTRSAGSPSGGSDVTGAGTGPAFCRPTTPAAACM